jgi:hypothetical protein
MHLLKGAAVIACLTAVSLLPVRAQDAAPAEETAPAPDVDAAPAKPDTAHLMGLNKITARTHPMRVGLDAPLRFGTLGITVRACEKARPEDPPKTIAFLEIREYPVNETLEEEPAPIFSGWMLASSPGLNALEHPVYDVWLTDCSTSAG